MAVQMRSLHCRPRSLRVPCVIRRSSTMKRIACSAGVVGNFTSRIKPAKPNCSDILSLPILSLPPLTFYRTWFILFSILGLLSLFDPRRKDFNMVRSRDKHTFVESGINFSDHKAVGSRVGVRMPELNSDGIRCTAGILPAWETRQKQGRLRYLSCSCVRNRVSSMAERSITPWPLFFARGVAVFTEAPLTPPPHTHAQRTIFSTSIGELP